MLENKIQKSQLYNQPSIHSYLQPFHQQLTQNQQQLNLSSQFQLRESTRGSLQKALSPVRNSTQKNVSLLKQNSKNQFRNSIKEDNNSINSKIATSQSLLKNSSNIYGGINFDSNKPNTDLAYSPYMKTSNVQRNVNLSTQQIKQSTQNLTYLLTKGKESKTDQKVNESKSAEPKTIEVKLTEQKQQESKSLEQRCLNNQQIDSDEKGIQKLINNTINNDIYQTPQSKINLSKQFDNQTQQLYQVQSSNGNSIYSNNVQQKSQGTQNHGTFTPTSQANNICTINLFENQDILKNLNSSNNKNVTNNIESNNHLNTNQSRSPVNSTQNNTNNRLILQLNSQLHSSGLVSTPKQNQVPIKNQKNTYLGYTRNDIYQNNINIQLKPNNQQQSSSTDTKSMQQKTKQIDLVSSNTASKKPITKSQLQQQTAIKNSYLNISNKTDLQSTISNTFNNNNSSLSKNLQNGYINPGNNTFQNRTSSHESDYDVNNSSKYQLQNSINSTKLSTQPIVTNLYYKLGQDNQQKAPPPSQFIENRGIDSIGRDYNSLGIGHESLGRGLDSLGGGQDSERRHLKLSQYNEQQSPTLVQLKSDYGQKSQDTSPYKDYRELTIKLQECDINSNFSCYTCKTKKAKYFIITTNLIHLHFCSKCGIEYVQKHYPSNQITGNSISTGIGGSNTESYLSPAKNTSQPLQTIDLRPQEQFNLSPNNINSQNIVSKKNLNEDSFQFQNFSNNKTQNYINKIIPLDKQLKESDIQAQSTQNTSSSPLNYKVDSQINVDLINYIQDINTKSSEKSPQSYQYNTLYNQNSTFSQISQYLQNPQYSQNNQNIQYSQNAKNSQNTQNSYSPSQNSTQPLKNILSQNYLIQNLQHSPQNQSQTHQTDLSINNKIENLNQYKQTQIDGDLIVRNDNKNNIIDLTGIYPMSQALQDFKSQISQVFQSSPTQQQSNQGINITPENKQQNLTLNQNSQTQQQSYNQYSPTQNLQLHNQYQQNQQKESFSLNYNNQPNKEEQVQHQLKQNQEHNQKQLPQGNGSSEYQQKKQLVIIVDGEIGEEERIKRLKLSEFQLKLFKVKDEFEGLQKLFQEKNDTSMQEYHKSIEYIDNIQRSIIESMNEITQKIKESLLNNFNENLQKFKKSKFEIQQILNYLNCTENDLMSNLDSIIKDMDIDSLKDIIQQYDIVIQQYEDTKTQKFINQSFSIYQMKFQNDTTQLNLCCFKIQEEIKNLLTTMNYTQNIQKNQINTNTNQQFVLQNSFSNQQSKSIYVSFENRDIFQSAAQSNSEQYHPETQPQSPSFQSSRSLAQQQMMQNSLQNVQSSQQSLSQLIQNSPQSTQYKQIDVQPQMLNGQNLQQNIQNQNYNIQYPTQNASSAMQPPQQLLTFKDVIFSEEQNQQLAKQQGQSTQLTSNQLHQQVLNQPQMPQSDIAVTKHIIPISSDFTLKPSSFGGEQKSQKAESPPSQFIKSQNYNYYSPLNNTLKDQQYLQEEESTKKAFSQKDVNQNNGLYFNSPYSTKSTDILKTNFQNQSYTLDNSNQKEQSYSFQNNQQQQTQNQNDYQQNNNQEKKELNVNDQKNTNENPEITKQYELQQIQKTLLDKYGMNGKDKTQLKTLDNLLSKQDSQYKTKEDNINTLGVSPQNYNSIQSKDNQDGLLNNQSQATNLNNTNSSNDPNNLSIKNKQKYNELLQKIQNHQSQTEKLCTDVLSSGNNFKFSQLEENIPSSQNSSRQSQQLNLSKK